LLRGNGLTSNFSPHRPGWKSGTSFQPRMHFIGAGRLTRLELIGADH
jgi:hypothetical protein